MAKFSVPWQQYNIITAYKKEKVNEKDVVTRQKLDDYLAKHSNVSLSYNNKSQIVTLTARNQKRFDLAKQEFTQMIETSINDYHDFMEKVKQNKHNRNLQEFKRKQRELENSVKQELLNMANADNKEVVKTTISTNSNNPFHLLSNDDSSSESESEQPDQIKIRRDSPTFTSTPTSDNEDTGYWMPVTKMPVSVKSYRANRNRNKDKSQFTKKNETEDFSDIEAPVVKDSLQQLIAIDNDEEFPPLIRH
jgi:hypothetical protein